MSFTEKEFENPLEIPTKETPGEGLIEEPVEEPTEEPIEEPIEELEKSIEESTKEPPEEPIEQQEKKYKKVLIGGIILLFALLVIYLGMVKYFRSHFYLGTEINGKDVSGKTLEDVEAMMADVHNGYTLNIKERGGAIEQIKAHDVGLKYSSEELKKIIDSQSGFKWVIAWFAAEDYKRTVVLDYNERLLKERINLLSIFKPDHIVEPKNPTFNYVNGSYVIVDGEIGNKVDKDIFYSHVGDSLRKMEPEIDLQLLGCYVNPQYDSTSPKIQDVKNKLDKYVATIITYTFGEHETVLDGVQINHWLSINENFNIIINEEMVKNYLNELSHTYNTVDRVINFVTSTGETIKMSGGDYVRSINKIKELQYIISAIQKGEIVTKEPIYDENNISKGSNSYIGNTYVEISLEKQQIWFYKNGSLIVEGNVVTGNVSQNYSTRKGIFNLKYKARDVVLRGADYAVHVDFWMPFDGGIGIHDASWRSAFGGKIYRTNGSHGCVNSPYNVAKAIFNNITPGTPVVCY